MSQPILTAPIDKILRQILLVFIGTTSAYVILRNLFAKRHWVAWTIAQFVLGLMGTVLTMWLIVRMGFHGGWIQFAGIAIGFVFAYRLLAPLTLQEWNQRRKRAIPGHLRKKVIERHMRLTGSYDPSREHIDHVYPFAKGGGHTLDNLHVISKEQNQRKRDEEPVVMDWARADFARARAFVRRKLAFSKATLPRR